MPGNQGFINERRFSSTVLEWNFLWFEKQMSAQNEKHNLSSKGFC